MSFVATAFKGLGFVIGCVGALFVMMALTGGMGWPSELFMSWPYLVATIGIISALTLGLSGWPRFATGLFAGSLVVVAMAMAAPGDVTRARAPTPNPDNLHLIWGNAMRQSSNVENLIGRAAAVKGSVLAVGEIPYRWAWQAAPERDGLNLTRAGERLIEIGVEGCAKTHVPFTKQSTFSFPPRLRTYAIKVVCPDYTLFAVHLTNPLWEWGKRLERRNLELDALATAVKAETGPVVIIGDFNTPPNALPFSRFIKRANVDHTSCGGRWLPTWRPYGWRTKFKSGNPLTGIPIDHLFTRDIDVVSCTVGEDFGSDHLPLVVELKKPSATPTQIAP
jgi:hypothetical protein